MSTTVELFVDYVCPYCLLVEDTVAELERERDVEAGGRLPAAGLARVRLPDGPAADIGEDGVIVEVGATVGLDRSEVERALASEERRSRQLAEQRYATDSVGVRAVPSFRIGGRLHSGVLDADRLKKAVDEAAGREPLL